MRKATLVRTETGDQGTFGRLTTDSGFACATGELPWRENERQHSCIPPGEYLCTWRRSPKHGLCYHVENVPGRTLIQIHAANFCGDETKGLKCDLLGCIAPGTKLGKIEGQRALTGSRVALTRLETDLGWETFELTIIEATEPSEA